jgi:hypothetical protein
VAASSKSYDSELKTFRTQFLRAQNRSEFTTLLAQHDRSIQEDETGTGEGKGFHAFKQLTVIRGSRLLPAPMVSGGNYSQHYNVSQTSAKPIARNFGAVAIVGVQVHPYLHFNKQTIFHRIRPQPADFFRSFNCDFAGSRLISVSEVIARVSCAKGNARPPSSRGKQQVGEAVFCEKRFVRTLISE